MNTFSCPMNTFSRSMNTFLCPSNTRLRARPGGQVRWGSHGRREGRREGGREGWRITPSWTSLNSSSVIGSRQIFQGLPLHPCACSAPCPCPSASLPLPILLREMPEFTHFTLHRHVQTLQCVGCSKVQCSGQARIVLPGKARAQTKWLPQSSGKQQRSSKAPKHEAQSKKWYVFGGERRCKAFLHVYDRLSWVLDSFKSGQRWDEEGWVSVGCMRGCEMQAPGHQF